MAPDLRRSAALFLVGLLVVSLVATPASAAPDGDHGGGKGNGGSGGGGSNGGSSNGGGSGQGGGGGSGSQGGSGSGGGGSGSHGGSSSSQGPSSSDSSQAGGKSAEHRADASKAAGHGSSQSTSDDVPEDAGEGASPAVPVDATGSAPDSSDGAAPSASSSGPRFDVGVINDVVQVSGTLLKAIERRADMAEILSTDADSPLVSIGMIVLAAGAMSILFGTVRTDNRGATRRHGHPGGDADAETLRHRDAALAAGLSASVWSGLERATYVKLMSMDAQTVAFWMGSDPESVRRWQAGRTLADDIQDGIVVHELAWSEEWVLPQARHAPATAAHGGASQTSFGQE